MSEEEHKQGKEIREEAPVYLERYQQAREKYLAAELRRVDEAIGHNANRIRDFRADMDRQLAGLRSQIDQRFEVVDQRFEAVDQRFEAVDQRFEAVDQRFEAVNQRFDSLERQLDQRFATLERQIDQRFSAFERQMDQRFSDSEDREEQRFKSVDLQFKSVDLQFKDLREELQRRDRSLRAFAALVIASQATIFAILVKLLFR